MSALASEADRQKIRAATTINQGLLQDCREPDGYGRRTLLRLPSLSASQGSALKNLPTVIVDLAPLTVIFVDGRQKPQNRFSQSGSNVDCGLMAGNIVPRKHTSVWVGLRRFLAKLYAAIERSQRKRADRIIQRYSHLLPDPDEHHNGMEKYVIRTPQSDRVHRAVALTERPCP
jgi:hypothetical protein